MKVNSPLANMDIYIGRVSKSSGGLLVESREDSTMSAEILVGPRDARDFLLSLLKKPLVLLYLLALPLIGLFSSPVSDEHGGAAGRLDDPLNKPW